MGISLNAVEMSADLNLGGGGFGPEFASVGMSRTMSLRRGGADDELDAILLSAR